MTTDHEYEKSRGRLCVWLDVPDVIWLQRRCLCGESAYPDNDHCLRVRFRATRALEAAGIAIPEEPRPNEPLEPGVFTVLGWGNFLESKMGLVVVQPFFRLEYWGILPKDVLIEGNNCTLSDITAFRKFIGQTVQEGKAALRFLRNRQTYQLIAPSGEETDYSVEWSLSAIRNGEIPPG